MPVCSLIECAEWQDEGSEAEKWQPDGFDRLELSAIVALYESEARGKLALSRDDFERTMHRLMGIDIRRPGDGSANCAALFELFDYKKSGTIDLSELLVGLALVARGSLLHRLEAVFRMFDSNHSGTIDEFELRTMLAHLLPAEQRVHLPMIVEQVLREADLNADRQLSWAEFSRCTLSGDVMQWIEQLVQHFEAALSQRTGQHRRLSVWAQEAAPVATVRVDTNGDGRPDTMVTGVDRNRDGIPDGLQGDDSEESKLGFELTLNLDFDQWDVNKPKVLGALAENLDVDTNQIQILQAHAGSTILDLEIASAVAETPRLAGRVSHLQEEGSLAGIPILSVTAPVMGGGCGYGAGFRNYGPRAGMPYVNPRGGMYAPQATAGVDTTGDGRANYMVTGVDRNRDGIPDALQGGIQGAAMRAAAQRAASGRGSLTELANDTLAAIDQLSVAHPNANLYSTPSWVANDLASSLEGSVNAREANLYMNTTRATREPVYLKGKRLRVSPKRAMKAKRRLVMNIDCASLKVCPLNGMNQSQ